MKITRIAESINVMSKTLGPAMKGRDPKPIQEMAIKQQEKGVDVLDLNIGPARKEGDKLMEWMPTSGYQPDHRMCYEVYLNDPDTHPEKKWLVDICEPVRPL